MTNGHGKAAAAPARDDAAPDAAVSGDKNGSRRNKKIDDVDPAVRQADG